MKSLGSVFIFFAMKVAKSHALPLMTALQKRFHLNSNMIGLCPHMQKLSWQIISQLTHAVKLWKGQ